MPSPDFATHDIIVNLAKIDMLQCPAQFSPQRSRSVSRTCLNFLAAQARAETDSQLGSLCQTFFQRPGTLFLIFF